MSVQRRDQKHVAGQMIGYQRALMILGGIPDATHGDETPLAKATATENAASILQSVIPDSKTAPALYRESLGLEDPSQAWLLERIVKERGSASHPVSDASFKALLALIAGPSGSISRREFSIAIAPLEPFLSTNQKQLLKNARFRQETANTLFGHKGRVAAHTMGTAAVGPVSGIGLSRLTGILLQKNLEAFSGPLGAVAFILGHRLTEKFVAEPWTKKAQRPEFGCNRGLEKNIEIPLRRLYDFIHQTESAKDEHATNAADFANGIMMAMNTFGQLSEAENRIMACASQFVADVSKNGYSEARTRFLANVQQTDLAALKAIPLPPRPKDFEGEVARAIELVADEGLRQALPILSATVDEAMKWAASVPVSKKDPHSMKVRAPQEIVDIVRELVGPSPSEWDLYALTKLAKAFDFDLAEIWPDSAVWTVTLPGNLSATPRDLFAAIDTLPPRMAALRQEARTQKVFTWIGYVLQGASGAGTAFGFFTGLLSMIPAIGAHYAVGRIQKAKLYAAAEARTTAGLEDTGLASVNPNLFLLDRISHPNRWLHTGDRVEALRIRARTMSSAFSLLGAEWPVARNIAERLGLIAKSALQSEAGVREEIMDLLAGVAPPDHIRRLLTTTVAAFGQADSHAAIDQAVCARRAFLDNIVAIHKAAAEENSNVKDKTFNFELHRTAQAMLDSLATLDKRQGNCLRACDASMLGDSAPNPSPGMRIEDFASAIVKDPNGIVDLDVVGAFAGFRNALDSSIAKWQAAESKLTSERAVEIAQQVLDFVACDFLPLVGEESRSPGWAKISGHAEAIEETDGWLIHRSLKGGGAISLKVAFDGKPVAESLRLDLGDRHLRSIAENVAQEWLSARLGAPMRVHAKRVDAVDHVGNVQASAVGQDKLYAVRLVAANGTAYLLALTPEGIPLFQTLRPQT